VYDDATLVRFGVNEFSRFATGGGPTVGRDLEVSRRPAFRSDLSRHPFLVEKTTVVRVG
jgi:hypothetical protein